MVYRVLTEKRENFALSSSNIANEIRSVLGIDFGDLREFIRYDVEGVSATDFATLCSTVFAEPPIDRVFTDKLPTDMQNYKVFVIEYLPGQYDQRADSAAQCIQLVTMKERPNVKCARVIAIKGVTDGEFYAVKAYMINPVECVEGSLYKPETLAEEISEAPQVTQIEGFGLMSDAELVALHESYAFAMSLEDLKCVRTYFKREGRAPTETELRVIDTYWSDHCRHTTFLTELDSIDIASDNPHLAEALELYEKTAAEVHAGNENKYRSLMDIATVAMKKLKSDGKLADLDESDEINACSINVKADVNGKDEDWLVMFKNETHNHPTEIEPFGGAATCLGGAIRDPLSGRAYVYQAMRVTGSGDPNVSVSETISGKLPQRVITKSAAQGFSSYGNQIGLATGGVYEMYHERYRAKRLETGFVIAGAPKANVIRRTPISGDVVILLGGETGRDGCGGATGSSKSHTVLSLRKSGAEVQKGNPVTERKIQRLFRKPEVSGLIVRCNDFGAGGVAVAIGELADSLDIRLDAIPKKYAGLSATELAISESQERMAVVVPKGSVDLFIKLASAENLSATPVAEVTDTGSLRMFSNGRAVVELSREFLNTNGAKQHAAAKVADKVSTYMNRPSDGASVYIAKEDFKSALMYELSRLNVCSKKGLVEMFDSSIGAGSVLMPLGGVTGLTPSDAMAAKLPVQGETDTATVCAYGCSPMLLEESPFTGAVYSVISALSKLIATGAPYDGIRFTLQEYFKKLGNDPLRWGEPVGALLGAFYAQMKLGLPAIGGKDSMSGSYEKMDVPPTLIAFGVGLHKASKIIGNAFTAPGAKIYRLRLPRDEFNMPDWRRIPEFYKAISKQIDAGAIVSAGVIDEDAAVSAIKMSIGNGYGFRFLHIEEDQFLPAFGDLLVEAGENRTIIGVSAEYLGKTTADGKTYIDFGVEAEMSELKDAFTWRLDNVFPTVARASGSAKNVSFTRSSDRPMQASFLHGTPVPKVFIPVFPGTNCEYDTARAFELSGAKTDVFVIKNRSQHDIEDSVIEIVKRIRGSQMIAFPGGFSGGDEPDGSGKFVVATFSNPRIADAVNDLLYNRDGLILGICNGFQALVKLGLLPNGKIEPQTETSPTLTFNNINRHVSAIVRTRVATNNSPWLVHSKVGDIVSVPISHGEGRFVASDEQIEQLILNGQIATQYVDLSGNATMESPYNPNGSAMAVEGLISKDGKVFGKMGHTERFSKNLYKNVPGNFELRIFESGVDYYR